MAPASSNGGQGNEGGEGGEDGEGGGAAGESGPSTEKWGTPLEVSLDRCVVICEAFGEIPARSPSSAAGAHESVSRWLSLHEPLLRAALRRRPPGERLELFPSPALPSLAAGLAGLMDEGAVITIDYGADAATLIQAARRVKARPPAPTQPADATSASTSTSNSASTSNTAPSRSTAAAAILAASRSSSGLRVRSRLPAAPGRGAALALTRPGWSDLTTDVDFTELAACGEREGLSTIFFGPQTCLQRVYSPAHLPGAAVPPPRVTDASPPLRKGVCEAFYALGSFVMLVQASPALASRWSWGVASQELYGSGHGSTGGMALQHTLRSLSRIALEHACLLQSRRAGAASTAASVPSERELAASLADALVPSVPCFRAHWRALAAEARRALAGEPADLSTLPPRYHEAVALMRLDLEELRRCPEGGPRARVGVQQHKRPGPES
jgi:hypothetical protein